MKAVDEVDPVGSWGPVRDQSDRPLAENASVRAL